MGVTGKKLQGADLGTVLVVHTIINSLRVLLARRILLPVTALTGALFTSFSHWGAV